MDFHFFLFLFRVIEVTTRSYTITTGHKKWPKLGQNRIIFFFARRAKENLGRRLEHEVGLCSGPYILVILTFQYNKLSER